MHLKITAPDQVIFEWKIEKITIPTEWWELTILDNHQPLATVIKAWLACITPVIWEEIKEWFVKKDGKFYIALTKWMLYVDWSNLIVTTSAATTSPSESEEILQKMKWDMEAELEKIKVEGNKEDLEAAMINLEKVTADLRLTKLKNVH